MASTNTPSPFGQQIGNDIVSIIVRTGLNQKTFKVHKDLLCQKVPFFAAMFNTGFLESKTQSATLPEDDSNSFEHFLGWLYRDSIGYIDHIDEHTLVFGFAEKYDLLHLMDLTIDSLVCKLRGDNSMLEMARIEIMYLVTHEKSKLRELAARCQAFVVLELGGEEIWRSDNLLPKGPDRDQITIDCYRQMNVR
ncbi:hypothetical protein VTL71DRAFT_7277 [Oculimacula yallundae]|uniref:BTB domain-containing protein n=1 Tax=Oculimacula yallundae TaxID=86028 RepID=A0ABR4BW82_9HELO